MSGRTAIIAIAIVMSLPQASQAASDSIGISRISMLHREGARTLVFAVGHPEPRCTQVTVERGKDGLIHLHAPADTGNCKQKKISSLIRVEVSDREILDGLVRIIPPPEWGNRNAKTEYAFGIRGSIVDPFADEREKIIRSRK